MRSAFSTDSICFASLTDTFIVVLLQYRYATQFMNMKKNEQQMYMLAHGGLQVQLDGETFVKKAYDFKEQRKRCDSIYFSYFSSHSRRRTKFITQHILDNTGYECVAFWKKKKKQH